MNRRRLSSRDSPRIHHGEAQLSLAIDPPAGRGPRVSAARPVSRDKEPKRAIDLEPIMWMRDVVLLTDTHRSTIHRWMRTGFFPRKDAPKDHPRGWLRSTIERWQLGTPASGARSRAGHE
jgi:predicted DNA-binding transcriptional regulator AlpA